MCRSRKGAWIEISSNYENQGTQGVVAPVRERGLKWLLRAKQGKMRRRSREGAWIEIAVRKSSRRGTLVAPVRERGLKYGTWLDFRFC